MHDPTEHVQEHLQHTAAHGDHDEHGGHDDHGGHGHSSRWITAAALTAAILAAFAAISGAFSTHHLVESTHRRIDANDQWSYYQSKSIKSSNIDTRIYMAKLAKAPAPAKDIAKKAQYEGELHDIQERADVLVKISDQHVEDHEIYETCETLFHISIAIVAIAVVAKRRSFWYVSMLTGAVGLVFFVLAATHHIDVEPAEPPAANASASPGAEKQGSGERVSPAAEHSGEAAAEHGHAQGRSENPAPAATAP